MRRRTRFALCWLIAAIALFGLQGCFGNSAEDGFDWSLLSNVERNPNVIAGLVAAGDMEPSPFAGETLTIAISDSTVNDHIRYDNGYNWFLFSSSFKQMHQGVEVEIVVYELTEGIPQRLQVELMAGTGPDLFQGAVVQFPHVVNPQVFADWLPLMESHPGFVEEDWNMDIFDVVTQEFGRLIGFPAALNYMHVLANRHIPGLADAFAERDSITVFDLLDLYDEFLQGNEDSRFSVSHSGRVNYPWFHNLFQTVIHDFFDRNTGKVDFASEKFIDFLKRADSTFFNKDSINFRYEAIYDNMYDNYVLLGPSVFFSFQPGFYMESVFYLRGLESPFVNPLPIVSSDGSLILSDWFQAANFTWLLNSASSTTVQAMAMDFMLHMARAFTGNSLNFRNPFHAPQALWATTGLPTRKDGLEHLDLSIADINNRHYHGVRYNTRVLTIEEMAENYMEVISAYQQMDKRLMASVPLAIRITIMNEIDSFLDGVQSAEETAARLQNMVTLALMEQE